jgi:hypothetical protein
MLIHGNLKRVMKIIKNIIMNPTWYTFVMKFIHRYAKVKELSIDLG